MIFTYIVGFSILLLFSFLSRNGRFSLNRLFYALNNGRQLNGAVSCTTDCKGFFTYFLCLPLDLQMNTEVFIIWAMHTTNDASSGSSTLGPQHTSRGISVAKHNLIAEAMAAAGITPTTATMMIPSITFTSTPQPTGNVD